jgi:hypothetical protein
MYYNIKKDEIIKAMNKEKELEQELLKEKDNLLK